MQATHTQHYANADDFFELFTEGDFDKQVLTGPFWKGLVYNATTGKYEVYASFVFDNMQRTSGVGSVV